MAQFPPPSKPASSEINLLRMALYTQSGPNKDGFDETKGFIHHKARLDIAPNWDHIHFC
jgi:hypothetical protein